MKKGAVVLAGGNGSRMGKRKENLLFQGESFLDRIKAELSDYDELLISVADSKKFSPNRRIKYVSDIYKDHGPMGGLHAALTGCTSDALLAVACDLPMFGNEIGIRLFSQLSTKTDAVIPMTRDGRMHPLCAVYRKRAALVFERYLEEGNNRLRDVLRQMSVQYVFIDKAEERFFQNINTVQDYQLLCESEDQKEL